MYFRSYTLRIGEPENNRGFLSSGKVVGWGQTYTDADDVSTFDQFTYPKISMLYQESKTVPSARQQKLKMPFVSNQNCIEKFRTFGVNLENDIRFELVCYFVI